VSHVERFRNIWFSSSPIRQLSQRELPVAWGYTSDGRYIIAVYEHVDELTVIPVTAYEVPEPK
jgi:hypothetical protein